MYVIGEALEVVLIADLITLMRSNLQRQVNHRTVYVILKHQPRPSATTSTQAPAQPSNTNNNNTSIVLHNSHDKNNVTVSPQLSTLVGMIKNITHHQHEQQTIALTSPSNETVIARTYDCLVHAFSFGIQLMAKQSVSLSMVNNLVIYVMLPSVCCVQYWTTLSACLLLSVRQQLRPKSIVEYQVLILTFPTMLL